MTQQSISPFIRTIQELYELEAAYAEDQEEINTRVVSFNFPTHDAFMFAAIAKRFGKSTAAFGGEVFAEHVRELFIGLTPEDRRQLAIEADAESAKFLASKGYSSRGNSWESYADICDKHYGVKS